MPNSNVTRASLSAGTMDSSPASAGKLIIEAARSRGA
jgi:hypothetical protein